MIGLGVGWTHSCALNLEGALRCWGNNESGQVDVPPTLGEVVGVSAGSDFTCALAEDGKLHCFGGNEFGQIDVPLNLGPVSTVVAGGYHACALLVDGTATCWGLDLDYYGFPSGQTQVPRALDDLIEFCLLYTSPSPRDS